VCLSLHGVTTIANPGPIRATAAAGGKPSGYIVWLKPESLAGAEDSEIATWSDSSGNGNDATAASNRPTTKQGTFDGLSSALFDSALEHLDTASISHGVGTGDFTWTIWARPETTTGTYLSLLGNGSFAPGMYWKVSGTGIWGAFWTSDREATTVLSVNTWYHLTFLRSGTDLKFYVNSTLDDTIGSVSTSMSNAAFHIGTSDGSSGSLKKIGEVTFWTRALSAQEIIDDYNLRTP
jgi:hypothetical protein